MRCYQGGSVLVFVPFLLVFFLPLSYGTGFHDYTLIKEGDFNFRGTVKCANGNQVLPKGTITLKEADPGTFDDRIAESLIHNGFFKLSGSETDPMSDNDYLEVYVTFENVCKNEEYRETVRINVNGLSHYTIPDNNGKDVDYQSG